MARLPTTKAAKKDKRALVHVMNKSNEAVKTLFVTTDTPVSVLVTLLDEDDEKLAILYEVKKSCLQTL